MKTIVDKPMTPLEVGDTLPEIMLPNERTRLVRLSAWIDNRYVVFLFCPDPKQPACRAMLQSFARLADKLDPLAQVFGITNTTPDENAAFLGNNPLPFWLLSDMERQVARGLGITHNGNQGICSIVINDMSGRVIKIERDTNAADPAPAILEYLELLAKRPQPEARSLSHFAPVLYVPQVFEPELCRALINAFETGKHQPSGVLRPEKSAMEGKENLDASHKIRRDIEITDPKLLDWIRRRMGRRVLPEIQKVFTRQITSGEKLKVARYDSLDGGYFKPHRDNVVPRVQHRHFAMSLNLNKGEYEGGALRFPEYGPDLYSPDSGDAVIFSCSLLHEALPVTKGRRYVLLSFMFN